LAGNKIIYGQPAAVNSAKNSNTNVVSQELQIFTARVSSIILDDTHPRYEDQQRALGIGTIEYQQVDPPSNSPSNDLSPTAKPLFTNINHYPIVQELVICFRAPSRYSQVTTTNKDVYYLPPIGLWNSIHQNALPNSITEGTTAQASFNRNLDAVEAGAFNIINEAANFKGTSTQIGSKTFPEKENTQPLLPFEGDVIYEGRWGNSIRFGSTITNPTPTLSFQNNWSDYGSTGDPITIIRNGQTPTSPGFKFVTEKINTDDSSIWMTSNQQLKTLTLSNSDYSGFISTIKNPSIYASPQVIINSGRIILNSKSDNILLSSNKSISLNSNEDVNIKSSRNTVIDSTNLYLGSKDATEAVLLGDKTQKQLEFLCDALLTLVGPLTQLQTFVENTNGIVKKTPNANIQIGATAAQESINLVKSALQSGVIKSKLVKTI
tara:strand:- start:2824 stop:4128 length:1305 start_codon:yes stop_codon:yes gene_type:complete